MRKKRRAVTKEKKMYLLKDECKEQPKLTIIISGELIPRMK